MKSFKFLLAVLIISCFSFIALQSQATLRILQPRGGSGSQPGSIDELVIRAIPQGAYIEYRAYIRFSARGSSYKSDTDSLEIEFKFKLPPNSFINDSWLWFDSTIVKAQICDRWTAGLIYETTVGRWTKRDPSILNKNTQTDYELKVFPVSGTNSRRIKMNMYIPSVWEAKTISSFCPLNFLKASAQLAKRIRFITYPNGDFHNPRFNNNKKVVFNEVIDLEFGRVWAADIDSSDISNLDSLTFDATFHNGIFYSQICDAQYTYYQLAMNAPDYLDLTVPKKITYLVEWDQANSDFTKQEICNAIKSSINNYLKPYDKLNIFLSDTTVRMLSWDWVNADSLGKIQIDRFLLPDSIHSYSNMRALFEWGINWINSKKDTTIIYLLANTDDVGARDTTNSLITWIQGNLKYYNPIYIGSFTYKNYNSYPVGALNYTGNDYFYTNICRRTAGIFQKSHDNNNNLTTLMNNAFKEFMGSLDQFEFQTTAIGGFTHSKFFSNYKDRSLIDFNKPVIEIGKVYGTTPVELTASGFYRSQPFSKSTLIDSTKASPYNYWTNLIWISRNIINLETTKVQNPVTIHQILHESIDNRILSLYTAFLALEPVPADSINKLDLDIPVELMAFNADYLNNRIVLSWATASERNSDRFEIERADVLPSDITEYRKISELKANGISDKIVHYGPVADYEVQPGKSYYYRLKMIDLDGTYKYSQEILVETRESEEMYVSEAFPNPAGAKTVLEYSGISSNMEISLFDSYGRQSSAKITNIGGRITLDVSGLENGIYLAVIKSGEKSITRKINVVK